MEKLHNLDEKDFQDILKYKDLLLSNGKKLAQLDPNDDYWRDLSNETTLSRNGIFLESNMVESWVGATRKPKRILEIGTRTGGSLIALLCVYSKEEYTGIEEILSFDMWREYASTTPLSTLLSKLMGKKRNVNISEKFTRFAGNYVEKKSTDKVRKNLAAFNISSEKIKFISGDSTVKVPEYFKQNPDKKFDYILVDGGHSVEVATKDLDNVVAHAAQGGIILFDDLMPESYNLMGVWNKFKEKNIKDFDFFEIRHRKGIGFGIKK